MVSAVQKRYRLSKREDFSKVYRSGKSAANQQFVVYSMPNPDIAHFRAGVSASKKLGGAVVRNRLRRMVKEIVRNHAANIRPHYDFIIIVRKPALTMDYRGMEKSLLHLLRKGSLIERDQREKRKPDND